MRWTSTLAINSVGGSGLRSDRPNHLAGETMRIPLARLLLAVLTHLLCTGVPAAAEEMPQLPATLNEEVRMLPVGTGSANVELETTLLRTTWRGPFPTGGDQPWPAVRRSAL